MNYFGLRKVSVSLTRYANGKAGYATFTVKDAITAKKSKLITAIFDLFKKTNGVSTLILF
jgi:hypothetical protein